MLLEELKEAIHKMVEQITDKNILIKIYTFTLLYNFINDTPVS